MRVCGTGGTGGTSEGPDSGAFAVFLFAFLRKKGLFWWTLRLFSALISERIDSAMVEAAVRTVRSRRSGSIASFSSLSWDGSWGCRLNKDI